jgi:HAE1 family hydrophobic/amphiphilic exporter-1
MNIPKLSIERPVFVSCLIGLILVLGIMSFFTLGVDQFPSINMPVVNVVVPYRGAGPEEIETLIVKPLEDELSGLEGIDKITSSCLDGSGQITVKFTLETDAKDAERRIRDRVAMVRNRLPTDIDEPIIKRFDPSDSPVAILALECDLPAVKVFDFADDVLKPRFGQVDGVGTVHLMGTGKREIQVLLDREKLNRYQMGVNTVAGRIGANSQNVPLGKVERGENNMTFRAIGEYRDLDRIRQTVVSFAGSDVAVPVEKLGTVVDGAEEMKNYAFYNGKQTAVFIIYKQSGANTVEVVDRVLKKMDALNQEFKDQPGAPKLSVAMENAWMIRAILGNVEEAIAVAIVLTMLVVYLFLGSGVSALITLTAIPVSFLGAFAAMKMFGFTLNTLTLIALSLAVGLLVDDAIVVRENIWRHIEEGMRARDAALQGTLQVAMAVVATTSVIIAVFLPIAFLKGIVGQFFKEFGLTMVFAVAVSFLVAMTLGPLMSAYIVPKRKPGQEKVKVVWFLAWFDHFQTWLENKYVFLVRACIRKRLWVVIAAVAVFIASLGLVRFIPFSFMPKMEIGFFMLNLKAAPGVSLEAMRDKSVALGEQIRKHSEVKYVCCLVGDTSGAGGRDNTSTMLVQLVSEKNRTMATSSFMEVLRKELGPYQKDLQPQLANYDPMNGGAPFTLNLKGRDYQQLVEWSEKVKTEMQKVPGLTDLVTNYDGGKAEFQAKLDSQKLKTMGVLGVEAGGELRAQIDGAVPAKFRENGLEYDIRVRLQPDQRDLGKDFQKVMVPNQNHRMVRLSNVAEGVEALGPSMINRYNRSRYIQVTAQIKKGGALGDSLTEAKKFWRVCSCRRE